jgi:23S rRNA (uracil1939-C5)-methyltransferase
MKKGEIVEVDIADISLDRGARGTVTRGEHTYSCRVFGALPGQRVQVMITKRRGKKMEGRLLAVLKRAPNEVDAPCPVFGRCGGCALMNLSYPDQLAMKEQKVMALLEGAGITGFETLPIVPSPDIYGYRNKMEFTFGDDAPGGPLRLGLHQRGSFYNILDASQCMLADADMRAIVAGVCDYFAQRGTPYFHRRSHQGFLRHLVLRKAKATGEILVNLVTSTQQELDDQAFVAMLPELDLEGRLACVLHTENDSEGDVVRADRMHLLWGEPVIHEKILDLDFAISPFSFFQTNTAGAEKLYTVVRDFAASVLDANTETKPEIFDLYCGTGTIAQVMAPMAGRVTGIELVEEAVDAARENAQANGLDNCTFIAGDVLEQVKNLQGKPDVIILDPPREGIHPKAIFPILDFAPAAFVYVSCKPASLARDLPFFVEAGYRVEKVRCVDMFPHSTHIETVVLMSRVKG